MITPQSHFRILPCLFPPSRDNFLLVERARMEYLAKFRPTGTPMTNKSFIFSIVVGKFTSRLLLFPILRLCVYTTLSWNHGTTSQFNQVGSRNFPYSLSFRLLGYRWIRLHCLEFPYLRPMTDYAATRGSRRRIYKGNKIKFFFFHFK